MENSLNKEMNWLQKQIDNNPKSIVFARLAEQFLISNDYDKAIEICQQGLENHPDYATGYFILAKSLFGKKEFDEAEKQLKKVFYYDPKFLRAHKLYSELMKEIGWTRSVELSYKKILEIDPLDNTTRTLLDSFGNEEEPSIVAKDIQKEQPETKEPVADGLFEDDTDTDSFLDNTSEDDDYSDIFGDMDQPDDVKTEPFGDETSDLFADTDTETETEPATADDDDGLTAFTGFDEEPTTDEEPAAETLFEGSEDEDSDLEVASTEEETSPFFRHDTKEDEQEDESTSFEPSEMIHEDEESDDMAIDPESFFFEDETEDETADTELETSFDTHEEPELDETEETSFSMTDVDDEELLAEEESEEQPADFAPQEFEKEEARFSQILDEIFSPKLVEEEEREKQTLDTIERVVSKQDASTDEEEVETEADEDMDMDDDSEAFMSPDEVDAEEKDSSVPEQEIITKGGMAESLPQFQDEETADDDDAELPDELVTYEEDVEKLTSDLEDMEQQQIDAALSNAGSDEDIVDTEEMEEEEFSDFLSKMYGDEDDEPAVDEQGPEPETVTDEEEPEPESDADQGQLIGGSQSKPAAGPKPERITEKKPNVVSDEPDQEQENNLTSFTDDFIQGSVDGEDEVQATMEDFEDTEEDTSRLGVDDMVESDDDENLVFDEGLDDDELSAERPKEKFVTPTLGEIYAAQGQYEKAINVFELLLKKHPENEWYKSKLEYLRKRAQEESE